MTIKSTDRRFVVLCYHLVAAGLCMSGVAAAEDSNATTGQRTDAEVAAGSAADAPAVPAADAAIVDSLAPEAVVDTLPELTEALNLLHKMTAAMDSLLVFEQQVHSATEEQRQMLRLHAAKEIKTVQESPEKLLGLIEKLEGTGAPVDSIRSLFRNFMHEKMSIYERSFAFFADELNTLRSQRGVVPPEELGDLELKIETVRGRLDTVYQGMVETLAVADSLHIDTIAAWENVDRLLLANAQTLVGRLQIAVSQRDKLAQRVEDEEESGAAETEIGAGRIQLRYAERRVRSIAKSLDQAVRLLDKRGVDTTPYRRFTIKTTGEVTKDVLNPHVLVGLIGDYAEKIWEWLKDNLPTALVRVFIVLVFVGLFRLTFRLLWWMVKASRLVRLPRLSVALVDGLVRPVGTLAGFFIGLWFLGVNPGTMLAGLGVASVIIGLALQDSLSNFAAGFFILVTRPFDVDDVVQTGTVLGTVKKMGLANTTIRTFDGRRLMVPNRRIWADVIENRSVEAVRRVEITVRVGYKEDIDRVLELLHEIVEADERVLKSIEPDIFVADLDESWMMVAVRPWVKNKDWWPLLTQLPRMVRLRFAEEGIDIPYPRSDIAVAAGQNPFESDGDKATRSNTAGDTARAAATTDPKPPSPTRKP